MIWWILAAAVLWFVIGAWTCATLEQVVPGWRAWYEDGERRFGDDLFPAAFLAMWPAWWLLYWRYS